MTDKFQQWRKQQHFPKDDVEKQIILSRLMKAFKEDIKYSEEEVNDIISLAFDDFSTLRRELFNFGYLQRDPHKGIYWVVKKRLSDEDLDNIKKRQRKLQ